MAAAVVTVLRGRVPGCRRRGTRGRAALRACNVAAPPRIIRMIILKMS